MMYLPEDAAIAVLRAIAGPSFFLSIYLYRGSFSAYSIAFSKDPAEWEAYIQRDDKLILNPDEYDKTAIDYALEAGNYPFLKYLTEKGYIWFVGEVKKNIILDLVQEHQ